MPVVKCESLYCKQIRRMVGLENQLNGESDKGDVEEINDGVCEVYADVRTQASRATWTEKEAIEMVDTHIGKAANNNCSNIRQLRDSREELIQLAVSQNVGEEVPSEV